MTERLKTCVDAGGVMALFPLLADWSREELQALCVDIDAFWEADEKRIQEATNKALFKPEVFFSQKTVDRALKASKDAQMKTLAVCSEIYSVALYYLGDEAEVTVARG